MSYEATLKAHYAEVRTRLPVAPSVRRIAIVRAPKPKPKPIFETPINFCAPHSWRFLVAYAAAKYGVSSEEVLGNVRSRDIVLARQEAIYECYRHISMSLPALGRRFGRDHTTILHSIRRAAKRRLSTVSTGGQQVLDSLASKGLAGLCPEVVTQ
jgi:hypothetical protein